MRSVKRTDPNRRTALYRFFNADDQLLYVGITVDIQKRWSYHAKEQAERWWPLVARHTLEWHDTRAQASRAEVKAIKTENPLYNVLHTPRNRGPQGNRRGTITAATASPTRGAAVMKAIRENFPDSSFTQLDLLHVVSMTMAGVRQNLKTLLVRQELVIVGWRSGGRGSALYALPDSAAAKGELTFELPPAARVAPQRQRVRRPRPNRYGAYPTENTFRTLQRLKDLYGDAPFIRQQAAADLVMSIPGLMRQSASLEKHGFIRCIGRQDPAPGRPGHLSKLYVVTDAEVPASQPKEPSTHPSRSPLSPGRAKTARDQARLAMLKDAVRAFGTEPFTSFELAEASGIPLPTVYQRVRALADAGLLLNIGTQPRKGGGRRLQLWQVP
ncbi:GIY-YIG nuclease family protein [Streptomyces ardesiacus]|uniref:GIY-YIG nuclease family protein n=1 Tax=Streptomyces ardesiacus TaxID=285564 RepID=UPI0036F00F5B